MGYWGSAPWDNDDSADWFIEVFKRTNIDEVIETSLSKPVDDFSRDEIRSAIMLFVLLGRVSIYRVEKYENQLQHCIVKNKELKQHWSEGGWDRDPEIGQWLDSELAVLERRQNNVGVPLPNRPPIPQDLKEWWSNWID